MLEEFNIQVDAKYYLSTENNVHLFFKEMQHVHFPTYIQTSNIIRFTGLCPGFRNHKVIAFFQFSYYHESFFFLLQYTDSLLLISVCRMLPLLSVVLAHTQYSLIAIIENSFTLLQLQSLVRLSTVTLFLAFLLN